MAPKPFPYPLGVGVDICNINRIANILKDSTRRERLVRRITTRLEWPGIWGKFYLAHLAIARRRGSSMSGNTPEEAYKINALHLERRWRLPTLSDYANPLHDPSMSSDSDKVIDETTPLGQLATFLAGRWAAKEAVIKAHSYRRLSMQEISIISRPVDRSSHPSPTPIFKPAALIDPPCCQSVSMGKDVAAARALRNVAPEISQASLQRRLKVKESDRQIAEISISHDHGCAVAICTAVNEPVADTKMETIEDNGGGRPIHEPEWGDEGWFDEVNPFGAKDFTTPNSKLEDREPW